MNIQFAPTDSILRRHFRQLAGSVGLPELPQDSVLRRHYGQLLESRLARARSTPPCATALPSAAHASAASPRPAPERRNWLSRLLRRLTG